MFCICLYAINLYVDFLRVAWFSLIVHRFVSLKALYKFSIIIIVIVVVVVVYCCCSLRQSIELRGNGLT